MRPPLSTLVREWRFWFRVALGLSLGLIATANQFPQWLWSPVPPIARSGEVSSDLGPMPALFVGWAILLFLLPFHVRLTLLELLVVFAMAVMLISLSMPGIVPH